MLIFFKHVEKISDQLLKFCIFWVRKQVDSESNESSVVTFVQRNVLMYSVSQETIL